MSVGTILLDMFGATFRKKLLNSSAISLESVSKFPFERILDIEVLVFFELLMALRSICQVFLLSDWFLSNSDS